VAGEDPVEHDDAARVLRPGRRRPWATWDVHARDDEHGARRLGVLRGEPGGEVGVGAQQGDAALLALRGRRGAV
jgi:hypothetical protein